MQRRWSIVLGGVAALAAWSVPGLARPPAADAVGLSVLCPGLGDGTSLNLLEPSIVFEGDAITGEHTQLTTFSAPVAAGADADGTPAIGANQLKPIDIDGDGQLDIEMGIGLRTSTADETVGSDTGGTPLDELLTENFGFADDFVEHVTPPTPTPDPSAVSVLGYDVLLKVPDKSWIRRVPQGHYAARVGFRFDRVDVKGHVVDHLDVKFEVDALQAFARGATRFPDEVRMSVAQKLIPRPPTNPGDPPFYDDLAFLAVGQEVVYKGVAADDHPPLDTGATVTRVPVASEGGSDLLDVDLAWNRVPGDFAVGIGQTCPSERNLPPAAHFATNLPDPAPAGHDLDLAVRSGLGAGLDGSDEVRVEGRIEELPRLLDLLERDEVIDLVRSTDAVPTIRLRRLDLAVDDPTTDDDLPIHAEGRLGGLPPHVRVTPTRSEASGDLAAVTVDACPEIPADDLVTFFLPTAAQAIRDTGYVDGCLPFRAPRPKIREAHLVVQNFLPDGPYGGGPSATLPVAPPPEQQEEHTGRYERAGNDQPWRFVRIDLPAVERTAFVLAAAQHPYTPPLTDTGTLLVRVGADLHDVESATFRTEAGSRRPAGKDPQPDDRSTYGARDVTTISLEAAEEPLAQVIVQLDRRDDLNRPQDNKGAFVYARGTIAPLPGTIDTLSFGALGAGTAENVGDTSPLRLGWDLATPTTLDLTDVRLQLAGRDAADVEQPAVIVRGEAQLDVPRSGAVDVAERSAGGHETTVVAYDPVRFGGDSDLGLRLAARLTLADRQADRALRLSGSARVSEPLTVTLDRTTGASGSLVEAAVTACADASGCDNDVDLDAVTGPDTTIPTLASGVTPLAPVPPRPWASSRSAAANDLRVVVDPASGEDWGAHLELQDLAHLAYEPQDGGLCVRSGLTGPLTAELQTPRVWFDGRLSVVPAVARLRIAPDGGGAGEPWVWLDTTSCTTAEPPIEETAPAAGPGDDDVAGRPVLDAIAIASTPGSALGVLPAPPPPPGAATDDHLAVHAEQAGDGSAAVSADVRQHVPDHLLVWRPTTGCGEGGGTLADLFRDIAACSSPLWQHTDHQLAGVRVQSTRAQLGPLAVSAHVVGRPATGAPGALGDDWQIEGTIPELPGSIAAGVSLSTTEGIDWTDALLDVEASRPIGDVTVTVTDQRPDRVGFVGDAVSVPAGDPASEHPLPGEPEPPGHPDAETPRTAVPELSLALHHASDELHVTVRLRGGEELNEGPTVGSIPGHPICPGRTVERRGEPGIAYVDADVTLDGGSTPATDLVIDVVNGKDGPRATDPVGRLATVSSDEPIDATVHTRLTNLVVNQDLTTPDPISWYYDLLVLPGIVDLFVGDTDFSACVDFDLPLELQLTDTSIARLAVEDSVFALDTDQDQDAEAQLRVGEFVAPVDRTGIPTAYRTVHFNPSGAGEFDSPAPGVAEIGGWKTTTAVPVQPDTNDISNCHNENVAYDPGVPTPSTSTIPTGTVPGAVTSRDGTVTDVTLTRATFVLDLLWSEGSRAEMAELDMNDFSNDIACPGTALFRALARSGTPPTLLPVGQVETVSPEPAEFTITRADTEDQDFQFCWADGWDTSLANRPESADGPDYPVAVGADGTRYTLNVWRPVLDQTRCQVDLVARYPDGGIRWARTIVDGTSPPWVDEWGEIEWKVRILPVAADGSVEVQLLEQYVEPSGRRSVLAVAAGRLAANGRGQVLWGEGGGVSPILRQLVGLQRRLNPPDVSLAADRCTHESIVAPDGVATGVVRVWYMGNGDEVVEIVEPGEPAPDASVDYCYPFGGQYLVQYVDYQDGRVLRGRRWEVTVPG